MGVVLAELEGAAAVEVAVALAIEGAWDVGAWIGGCDGLGAGAVANDWAFTLEGGALYAADAAATQECKVSTRSGAVVWRQDSATIRLLGRKHGGSRRRIVRIAILHWSLRLKLWVVVASLRSRHGERIGRDSLTSIRPWSWEAWVGHHVIHRLLGYYGYVRGRRVPQENGPCLVFAWDERHREANGKACIGIVSLGGCNWW